MDTHGQELAETYLKMLNTHDPDLVDQFVAENYINHNAFVADGREANRQFWHAFFVALPDVSASMEDLVISGDRVVGRFVYRGTHTGDFPKPSDWPTGTSRAESSSRSSHARRLCPTMRA